MEEFDPTKYGAVKISDFRPEDYGATPVAPEPAPETGMQKTGRRLDAFFGGKQIGNTIGTAVARDQALTGKGVIETDYSKLSPAAISRLKAKGVPTTASAQRVETANTIKGPTKTQIAGDVGRVALNFLPVGKAAEGIEAGLKTLPLIRGAAKPIANLAAGAGAGALFTGYNNVAEGRPVSEGIKTGAAIGAALPALPILGRGLGKVTKATLGATTGEGAGSLGKFVESIRKGGESAEFARAGMRGQLGQEDVAKEARLGVSKLIDTRRESYRKNLETLANETHTTKGGQLYVKKFDNELGKTLYVPTDLNTKGMKDVMTKTLKAMDLTARGGMIDFSKRPTLDSKTIQQISDFVYTYDDLTPKGIDNLRQEITGFRKGGINLSAADNRFNLFVDKLAGNIKAYAEEKVPQLKVLNNKYEKETRMLKDVQNLLSLGDKKNADQAYQKLSKVFKGNSEMRKRLLEELNQAAGGNLIPKIVGTQFSNPLPGALRQGFGAAAGATTGSASGWSLLPIFATLATFSPRVVGELANMVGIGLRGKDALGKILFGIAENKNFTPGDVLLDKAKKLPLIPNKQGGFIKSAFNSPTVGETVYKGEKDLTTKILQDLEGRSTVSKQYIMDATNRGDLKQVERDLIRDVLKGEKETVNVSEFSKKVKEELLPLKRFEVNPAYESVTLPEGLRGNVANYSEHIYESPINNSAGDIHFNGASKKYFGHTRVEDIADNKTRRVIEVQSDLYQKGNLETHTSLNQKGVKGKTYGDVKDNAVKKLQQYNNPTAHFRMIREEIKKAAEEGKTKLQFPAGETAMKIEGLGGDNNRWLTRDDETLSKEHLKIGKEIIEDNFPDSGASWIITDVLEDGKFKAVPKHIMDNKKVANDVINKWKEEFDISGKVDTSNPIYKFYEKDLGRYLQKFGGKTIIDEKGVKWFEVPIKKEQSKQAVQAFGKIKLNPLFVGAGVGAAAVAGSRALLPNKK